LYSSGNIGSSLQTEIRFAYVILKYSEPIISAGSIGCIYYSKLWKKSQNKWEPKITYAIDT